MKDNYIRALLLIILAIMFISLIKKWEETFFNKNNDQQKTLKIEDNIYFNNKYKEKNIINKQINDEKKILHNKNDISNKYTNNKNIIINTNVFKNVKINLLNGAIISTLLSKYNISVNNKMPINIFTNKHNHKYIAKIIMSINTVPINIKFKSEGIKKENNKQILTLSAITNNLKITRTYTFIKNKYTILISQSIINNNSKPINIGINNLIIRNFNKTNNSYFNLFNSHKYNFTSIAYSKNKYNFTKKYFKDILKTNKYPIIINSNGKSWIAFLQHYFLSAWISKSNNSKIYYTIINNKIFKAGIFKNIIINPNELKNTSYILYAGPIIKDNLINIAPNLEKTLDYGILSFFSKIIFFIINHIYILVGNWGLAIILVTCLIKLLFYPLTAKSYRSMAKIKILHPKIKLLQELYKDDRHTIGKKIIELYKEEKINPLSGCLPIIIQIPIFISLYWVLLESIQLRQAPFIFWIHDLSVKDPYFILPILMGLSMILQQKLSPNTTDNIQAKIMIILPIAFIFLFISFPSGLVLYWLTNNLISILQQWIIIKYYNNK